ncbi:MAG: hypothetical protein MJE68_02180 [Proteobacteria bacterium]|nr:hypothetical protein [Pseudomonadota bacterium]
MCRNTLFLSLCSFALFIISVLKGADGDKDENGDETVDENEYLEDDDIDPKQVGKTLVSRESCEVLADIIQILRKDIGTCVSENYEVELSVV